MRVSSFVLLLFAIVFHPPVTSLAGGDPDESLFITKKIFTGAEPFSFWRAEHALGSGPSVTSDDRDGDGASNLEEYYRGTDPNDASSKASLTLVTLDSRLVHICHRRSKTSQDVQWRLFAASRLDDPDWAAVDPGEYRISVHDAQEWEDIVMEVDLAAAPSKYFKVELTETNGNPVHYDFADWNPAADGATDDGPKFKEFFAHVKSAGGGMVRIPPGVYSIEVASTNQAPIPSNVEIEATGAEFRFSESVPSRTIFAWLYDFDVNNFIWKGGRFVGHAFDLGLDPHTLNTWPPNAHIRCVHRRAERTFLPRSVVIADLIQNEAAFRL